MECCFFFSQNYLKFQLINWDQVDDHVFFFIKRNDNDNQTCCHAFILIPSLLH